MDYAEHTNFYFKLCIQCNSCLNIYSIDLPSSSLIFFKFRPDISKQYITFATNIKSEL